MSELFAREAWRLLEANFERVLEAPDDLAARGAMLVGAHQAGMAIEQSMLGATHACANPLTARYGTTHGVAIAVMLPHVVRWNAPFVGDRYDELLSASTRGQARMRTGFEVQTSNADRIKVEGRSPLADRLDALARAGGLPRTLGEIGASESDLPALAADAATQWTGNFNPRPFDAAAALLLYQNAGLRIRLKA